MINSPQQEPASPDRFVIEGLLTELQVSHGRQNLLAQIDKHYRSTSVITGAGAVVGDLYGQAAGAAAVALYDGEDTENFMCMIADQVVCGTFGGASKLPTGTPVRAVVQRQDNVLIAEGILSESEGLVWVGHAWGVKAERNANFKIATWCFCLTMVFIALSIIFVGVNPEWSEMETFGWGAVVAGILCFGMALWSSATMNALADPATHIFRLLGFSEPERINLNNYRYGIVHAHRLLHSDETNANHFNIHCYKQAVAEGKVRMASE